MANQGKWDSGLCGGVCGGDCGTCLGAWFCPCFLFGRTAQRLSRFPDTTTPDLCDTNCMILCASSCCHVHWIPTLLKRMDVRERFGIRGNGCTDCLASYFCFPCTLAQMETQVKTRAVAAHSAPSNQGYVPQQQGMVYQPAVPQQQQGMVYQPAEKPY